MPYIEMANKGKMRASAVSAAPAREKWKAYKSEQRWGMVLVIVLIMFAVALVIYTGYSTALDIP
ncbi:MAG: hypothetical protein IKL04_03770 [Lachnospiraceae bacterium]|nr:hypothetical protein [Lachnospiraceae bacterium]